MPATDWVAKARGKIEEIPLGSREYAEANGDMIRRTVAGIGIDSGKKSASAGIRIAFNISSAYLPQALSQRYKNCYDLEDLGSTVGISVPKETKISKRRRTIDETIAKLCPPGTYRNLYYGAVELNGAGMRYYGDMCLILKEEQFKDATLVLYRNSYDLDREPIRSRIRKGGTLASEAERLAGTRASAPDMVVCKIFDQAPSADRLLTSGVISDGILADEDYLEVPRTGPFGAAEIAEVRTSAADVAAEGRIADRLERGPLPNVAELLWRNRRRGAERAAGQARINLRVVTSSGRARS